MTSFTKNEIKKSFIALLNEKEFDKITIKEISKKCGINRNTFYYHYEDIYSLLDDVLMTEVNNVINDCNNESVNQKFVESIEFASKNKVALYHIFNSSNKEEFNNYLIKVVDVLLKHYIKKNNLLVTVSDAEEDIIIKFYIGAISYLITDWFKNGMKNEPTYVIDKLVDLIGKSLKESLIENSQNINNAQNSDIAN
jgi:hypothetical protein